MTLGIARRSLWFLLLLLISLPMGRNCGGEYKTGPLQHCYPHEEVFPEVARCPSHQSVTAERLQLPWWCALLESLFLLLLVKLLQL
ncbi:uncharacterized protein LOC108047933 [Drosophila rhopaloa]|uniref:Uncharacterized protein LOC108047933 n=1 Tax=Drosophila rhopaloa TaxID=1041015 RepID=A0A6P4FE80_DRORH|nr:uncharacterized protein LOC108047933 [Drosophila rhopaloa]